MKYEPTCEWVRVIRGRPAWVGGARVRSAAVRVARVRVARGRPAWVGGARVRVARVRVAHAWVPSGEGSELLGWEPLESEWLVFGEG